MKLINDDHFRKIFARRLRQILYARDMSQSELAKKSGISQTCISRYANGSRMPSGYCITKLAEALGCRVEDLTRE